LEWLRRRKTEIFVPQQWATVVRMARRKDPYLIVPLIYGDIYDLIYLAKTSMKFRKEDIKGGKTNWLQIRWLRYMKETFECDRFQEICDR
jgi:predicted metal-dependent phosphoesterase TrpH